MGLIPSITSYIRFFALLTPIILPAMAIFGSLYESNLKGFIYILGVLLSMGIGQALAVYAIKSHVPGGLSNPKQPDSFVSVADPACSLTSIVYGEINLVCPVLMLCL